MGGTGAVDQKPRGKCGIELFWYIFVHTLNSIFKRSLNASDQVSIFKTEFGGSGKNLVCVNLLGFSQSAGTLKCQRMAV